MIEEIFHIGSFSVSPFGVMLMLAFVAAYWQLARGLRQTGAGDADDASALLLWGGLGGIVGGKVYYAILYQDWRLLFDRAGLVWYGGLILGAAAFFWVVWRRRLDPWKVLDAGAPALALGYGVGRVGCFLVGDDYGVPTDLPWGVAFPVGPTPSHAGLLRSSFGVDIPPDVASNTLLEVHPTQLYETGTALLIWGLGLVLLRRGWRPGTAGLFVLALLAVERFGVEILRAKDDRFLGVFTVAQIISVLAFVLVLALILWRRQAASQEKAS